MLRILSPPAGLTLVLLSLTAAPPAQADPLTEILVDEMDRVMEGFGLQEVPPYYMSFQAVEQNRVMLTAEDGALSKDEAVRVRTVSTDVRVGDYELDNTRQLLDQFWTNLNRFDFAPIPLADDPAAIRPVLWARAEESYRNAVDRFALVRSNTTVKVQDKALADFSREDALQYSEPVPPLELDRDGWIALIREASGRLGDSEHVIDGGVRLEGEVVTRTFVSSEGTRVRHAWRHYRLGLFVDGIAEDGDELFLFESFDTHEQGRLPDRETVLAAAERLVETLESLREAPLADPFTGPVLLSGPAAGVFFHEIFGHRMEGHRQKEQFEAQTFAEKLGVPVLADFLSVRDDPTTAELAGVQLNGHYLYDDQGVKAKNVPLVDRGILRNFLTSRDPVDGVDRSNGHGRAQPGRTPVARQGNLIIEAHETHTEAELRSMLVEEIEEQDIEYGYYIDTIAGGFTFTGVVVPNAFNVRPVVVYRVYADGRPDELVRGVDLVGTALTSFSQIIAAGDTPAVFNGYCGAESGWVPVSAVAPPILVRRLETQKKERMRAKPPLLPPPARPGKEVL